jgi:hypothetical protein
VSTWTSLNIGVGFGAAIAEPFLNEPGVEHQAPDSSSTADRTASGTSAGDFTIR